MSLRHRIQEALGADGALSDMISGPSEPKTITAGAAVVLSALFDAFSTVLAFALLVLFAVDLLLGVFRSIHAGGLHAFSRDRFWRAFIRLGAAGCGVVLAVSIDVTLLDAGIWPEGDPTTSTVLAMTCFYFAASAARTLTYFFPQVGTALQGFIGRASSAAQPKEGADPKPEAPK